MEMFKCYLCQWTTECNAKSIEHMSEIHQIKMEIESYTKQFCCAKCEYTSNNVGELKEHMIKVHQKNGWEWWNEGIKVKFSCRECDIVFETEEILKVHVCNAQVKMSEQKECQSEKLDSDSDQDSTEDEEVGEVKEKMYEVKNWKGEFGNDPIGYAINHVRGKKNDFNNAVKQLQTLLVPGKTHTLGETTVMIHSEEKRPYKKIYEIEIMK